ncbi:MAG: TonB family protein [Bacteroidetes bacterium]|nr:MAG: TonB family protein [Bacteroidota bacterium]
MTTYMLEVSLIWAVFYLFYLAFLSRETYFEWNRAYLLGTLLFGLVLPLLPEMPAALPATPTHWLEPVVVGLGALEGTLTTVPGGAPSGGAGVDWLVVGYLLGAGVSLAAFLRGLWDLRRLRRCSEVRRRFGVEWVLTPRYHLPFTFWRSLFWSREYHLSPEDFRRVVRHELAHIRQGHTFDVLFLEVLRVAFWWNPVIHLYRSALGLQHEYLADREVLRSTRKQPYGHLLLRQSMSGPRFALANNLFPSHLKKRIVMMTRNQSGKAAWLKLLLVLPLMALLFYSFTRESAPQPLPPTPEWVTDTLPDKIFRVVEEMPRFPGCEDSGLSGKDLERCSQKKMIEFLMARLKYPREAVEQGLEGLVVIKFVVDKSGEVRTPELVRSVHPLLDAEALRIVDLMPEWVPGKQGGKPVSVQYMLPVKFVLPKQLPGDEVQARSSDEKAATLEVERFQVGPNPAGDRLFVELEAPAGDYQLGLFDTNGQVLAVKALSGYDGQRLKMEAFDLSRFPVGTYLVQLRALDSGRQIVRKVVRQ